MKRILFVISLLILILFFNLWANSETTWTGVVDNNWHNPDNWDNGVPGLSSTAIIPSDYTNMPHISSSVSVGEIQNHSYFIAEESVNIAGDYHGYADSQVDMNNSSWIVGGEVNLAGRINILDNSEMEVGGLVKCFGGSNLNVAGGNLIANCLGEYDENSTVTISNGNFQYLYDVSCDGIVNINGGTLSTGPSGDPVFSGLANSQININNGYFSIGEFNSSGTVNVQGGNAYLGSTTTNGTLNINSGSFNVNNEYLNNGTFDMTGGTATFNGNFNLSGTSSNTQSGGVLNLKGDVFLNSSLINSGTNGEIVFNSGTIQNVSGDWMTSISPTVTIKNGTTVNFDQSVSFGVDSFKVVNSTANLGSSYLEEITAGQGLLQLDGGILTIGGNRTMPPFANYDMNSTSKVTYKSSTHKQEVKNLPVSYPNLEISGTKTKYISAGDVTVENELILNQIIDIRDNNLILNSGATISNNGTSHVATTGTGFLTRKNVANGIFPVGDDTTTYNGFEFDNNGSSIDSFSVRVAPGITPSHPNDDYCLQKTWEIEKVGILNDALFTFKWTADQENSNFTQARINGRIQEFCCHTSPNWQEVSTPTYASGSGIRTDPYKADFGMNEVVSAFALGDSDHTLPVTDIPEDNNNGNLTYNQTKVLRQYPNPVADILKIDYQIKGSGKEQDVVIDIYNIKGQLVDKIEGDNGTVAINLAKYSSGTYFYRLANTNQRNVYRFAIIK